jgi:hypothetical protein
MVLIRVSESYKNSFANLPSERKWRCVLWIAYRRLCLKIQKTTVDYLLSLKLCYYVLLYEKNESLDCHYMSGQAESLIVITIHMYSPMHVCRTTTPSVGRRR